MSWAANVFSDQAVQPSGTSVSAPPPKALLDLRPGVEYRLPERPFPRINVPHAWSFTAMLTGFFSYRRLGGTNAKGRQGARLVVVKVGRTA